MTGDKGKADGWSKGEGVGSGDDEEDKNNET